ncbi:MAG: universal stress protein [Haliscomenobacter sp.]|nr:universal stress protein [Haliscomenobacter sp.]MBK8880234.1 universal stress protein [Haliscomenobacter sp.]
MKPTFERVLAALDLTDTDDRILEMAAALGPYLGMKKIYFLHVMPDFKVPHPVALEFHKLFSSGYPVDEKVRDDLAAKVQQVWGERPGTDLQVEVIEGKPFQKLLHWAEVKNIDLLIVGNKQVSEGSGITARRLARHSKCHVLMVPDGKAPGLQTILAPVDFSEPSAKSLEAALELARRQPKAKVHALYVMDLPPSDYYMRPFETEGFREALREAAQTAFQSFLGDHGFSENEVKKVLADNTLSNTAAYIHEYAQREGAEMIVLGAQGHSPIENFIFGSVTEKLVDEATDCAVLIIR